MTKTATKLNASGLRGEILDYLKTYGSCTADEVALHLNTDRNSSSPRFAELEKLHLVEKRIDQKTGNFIKRKSSSGVMVCVYYLRKYSK